MRGALTLSLIPSESAQEAPGRRHSHYAQCSQTVQTNLSETTLCPSSPQLAPPLSVSPCRYGSDCSLCLCESVTILTQFLISDPQLMIPDPQLLMYIQSSDPQFLISDPQLMIPDPQLLIIYPDRINVLVLTTRRT